MRKYILLLSAVTIAFAGCRTDAFVEPSIACDFTPTAFTVNENHPKAEAFRLKMQAYLQKGVPGMTVLVADSNGVWVGSAGYADINNEILMQPCHINKLGSITKMMMGTLIWQLIQDNQLDINDPISDYIPEVASRITNGNDITVGMLVNHTSGVYDIARDLGFNLAVVNDFTKRWTAEEVLTFVEGKPATNAPGESVSYSNTNTLLEGLIIEAITGKPHGQVLRENILTPLGLDNTYYYDYGSDFPSTRLAQGYLDFNNDGQASIQNISALNPGSATGYTGVYSTVEDLYVYMKALLVDQTLITPANLSFILNNMTEAYDGSWFSSYGAIHNEDRHLFDPSQPVYGHAGGDIGYSANLNYIPHNGTIYAATFNYGTNLPSALGDIVNELRDELMQIAAQ